MHRARSGRGRRRNKKAGERVTLTGFQQKRRIIEVGNLTELLRQN